MKNNFAVLKKKGLLYPDKSSLRLFAYLFRLSCPLCFLIIGLIDIHAEGSKQISPTANDRVNLNINNPSYNNFGMYNGADNQRLYVHIENPGSEQIFLGFSHGVNFAAYPCSIGACCVGPNVNENVGNVDTYFRIKNPNGVVVFGPQLINGANAPISNWQQAVNGPNQIVGAGGYNAFNYSPTMSGDYYVEFSRSPTANFGDLYYEWWDITVATTGGSPSAIDGRVFAKNWAFYVPSVNCNAGGFQCTAPNQFGVFDRPFQGSFNVYAASDSIVTKVDFNGSGFQPAAFNIFFNNTGTGNTGNVANDRKSLDTQLAGTSLYPLFLNDPDPVAYPSGTLGTYVGEPFVVGCDGNSGEFFVTVSKPGQIDLLIDLNQVSGAFKFDPGTEDVAMVIKIEPLPGEVPPYTRSIYWNGLDGLGGQVDLMSPFDFQMNYTQGIFHLPVFDAEFMDNGFTFQTVRPMPPPGAIPVNLYYDDSNIPDDNFNGNPKVQLNGCLAPCHAWNNACYGDLNTINTWFFGSEEKKQINEVSICLVEANDDMGSTFVDVPVTIDALDNDDGIAIDTAAISTTGVLQPANGTVLGIDLMTGEITYMPNMGFTGTDMFEYIICDTGMYVCDTALVTITINMPNPPVISNNSSDPTASTTYITGGTNPVDDYEATDADGETENGGGLTWTITGGPDADDLTIDPNTGLLTFNAPPDYDNPTDSDIDNFYTVEITITDELGQTDVQVLTIEILPDNDMDGIADGDDIDDDNDGILDVDELASSEVCYKICTVADGPNVGTYDRYDWNAAAVSPDPNYDNCCSNSIPTYLVGTHPFFPNITNWPTTNPNGYVNDQPPIGSYTTIITGGLFADVNYGAGQEKIASQAYLAIPPLSCFSGLVAGNEIIIHAEWFGNQHTSVWASPSFDESQAVEIGRISQKSGQVPNSNNPIGPFLTNGNPNPYWVGTSGQTGELVLPLSGSSMTRAYIYAGVLDSGALAGVNWEYSDDGGATWKVIPDSWLYAIKSDALAATASLVEWTCESGNCTSNLGGTDTEANVISNGGVVSMCSPLDTDEDGIPNHLDLDSDNDGCADAYEAGHGETVQMDSTIAGPYGNNGFAEIVESDDMLTATATYTLEDNGSGTPIFLDPLLYGALCPLPPEICGNGIDDDFDGLIDCDDPDVFHDPSLPDNDNDGIPDCCDNCTEDRDGDGIVDCEDLDPTGFFYYEHTGEIIPGATIVVQEVGTGNTANVNLILNGSTGLYEWTVSVPGLYEMIITPPTGWNFSNNCLQQDPPAYDPTGMSDPVNLGNGEDGSSGFLTSNTCTAYYLTFDLNASDPLIINNNIPLIPTTEIVCNDGIDNDEDGLIDCDDPDCQSIVTIIGDCTGMAVLNPDPNWTFQWLRDGNPIVGAINSFYVPSPAVFGEHSVEVTDQFSCVTTSSGVVACCNPTTPGVGGN